MLIDLQPLWTFLVLCKLFLPFFVVNGRQHSVRFPPDHREATLGQPSVPADPHNGENGGAHDGEPRTNKLLLASCDELFTFDVEDDWCM